jgi:hypothetical protein
MSPTTSFDLEEAPVVDEVLDEALLPTLQQPDQFDQALQGYKAQAGMLMPTDPASMKRCAAFIETCKVASKYAESRRKEIVDPLNKQVKEQNETWMPITKGFDALWREVDGRLSRYIYEQQQLAIAEQQKELARAAQERAALEKKEAEAKAAAAAAAQAGDQKAALKAEAKAEEFAMKAENVVAEVVTVQPKTLDLGGATLTAKAPKKVWSLSGWDKASKLYGDDARLRGIDPAWLLRFCVLDPVRLNAAYKSGETFPAPFGEVQEFGGSVLRGGK